MMRGVLELHFWEALIVVDSAVPNKLNLRYARKPSEGTVEDVLFVLLYFVVPVSEIFGGWVECL